VARKRQKKVTLETVQDRKAYYNGKSWYRFHWYPEVLWQGQLLPWGGKYRQKTHFVQFKPKLMHIVMRFRGTQYGITIFSLSNQSIISIREV
jgi:hypothetical protein